MLHGVLDIDEDRFIEEAKPVWKASIHFEDWCGRDSFHLPFDDDLFPLTEKSDQQLEEMYYRYRNHEYRTPNTEFVEQGKTPFKSKDGDRYPHISYHLSLKRFNDLLEDLCEEREIELIDDRIEEVRVEDEEIATIASDATEYDADLYVDATGFKRLLMRNLDNEYNHFDLPIDAAVVAQTDLPLSEVVPATVIESGEAGWFWQIDTYDCRDLGYVYSSSHMSAEEAKAEMMETRKEDISEADIQEYEFESGYYEKAWVGNCVAVGNALGFIEPLQSTALTQSALFAKKFAELVEKGYQLNNQGVRSLYNTFTSRAWRDVYEYISIHYKHAPGGTEFWEDVQSVNSEKTVPQYTHYQQNGFHLHQELDKGLEVPLGPFRFPHWAYFRVLRGFGVESEFYQNLDLDVRPEIASAIDESYEEIQKSVEEYLSYDEFYG
ncbi:tryptophan 7-halogenase [Halorussus caseinilyticus]|uniref:Tryptophan 7-halogenase n=1 Tax=Halorussus caseinilyticus TaxID=3034025 RepID=A0ABD5WUA8_9EURY